jgi:uncharacterized protein (TIGR03435 family)
MQMRDGQLIAQAVHLSNLVIFLSHRLHRKIIDETGIAGKYDMMLQSSPEEVGNEQRL